MLISAACIVLYKLTSLWIASWWAVGVFIWLTSNIWEKKLYFHFVDLCCWSQHASLSIEVWLLKLQNITLLLPMSTCILKALKLYFHVVDIWFFYEHMWWYGWMNILQVHIVLVKHLSFCYITRKETCMHK